jgi:hypothetical protein
MTGWHLQHLNALWWSGKEQSLEKKISSKNNMSLVSMLAAAQKLRLGPSFQG